MICHITTRQAWETALLEGEYRSPSLDLEGFIHCSYPEQVNDTARRYYEGQINLVVLWINPDLLSSELRVEEASSHAGKYPHIYGPLNPGAVVKITDLNINTI